MATTAATDKAVEAAAQPATSHSATVPPAVAQPASQPAAVQPAVTQASSSTQPSAASLGKRPRDWFGAAGDGGRSDAAAAVASKLQQVESTAKLSSIKSKLSKPKPVIGKSASEGAQKSNLTREELLADQERHRAVQQAKGKAVPHYRKV